MKEDRSSDSFGNNQSRNEAQSWGGGAGSRRRRCNVHLFFVFFVYSDTRCRESPSAWGTEHKKHVHVSFILNNGSHSPVVPILIIARGDGPKKLDSENGNLILCSKDPYMSEKNPILVSLKTTNYSRIPLIAKWYLGGPLTNSRMTKWSMDDMSLIWKRILVRIR